MKVRFETAQNCLRLIARGAVTDAFLSLGVSKDDFQRVCSAEAWIGTDRPRVTAVLNALMHGSCDVLGLPRIEVPAEFRAAVLCAFVHGGNLMVACNWLETGATAEDVAGGSMAPVRSRELFALCCMLEGESGPARAAWEKRTGIAVRQATQEAKANAKAS